MRTELSATRRTARVYALLAALLLLVTSATLWHEYASAHADNDTCDTCLTAHGATALAAAPVTTLALQTGLRLDTLSPSSIPAAAAPQYRARAPPL